jgi:hypothetical protein
MEDSVHPEVVCVGPSALGLLVVLSLGLCPRLICVAP